MPEGFPAVEVGPDIEQLRAVQAGEMTMFEVYADRVVTVKGVTGKIGDLIALCPKPLDEMTPDSINDWTADILVQSGYELPDEFAEMVNPIDTKKKF